MGLFKKVVLADRSRPTPTRSSTASRRARQSAPTIAWLGALCYALQLYFDFSGYSDMAIGLGCIFGLKLPLNFDIALQGDQYLRLLASLAHDHDALLHHLHLHAAGHAAACARRCSTRSGDGVKLPATARHAGRRHLPRRRHLARRRLDFRGLRPAAWRRDRDLSWLGATSTRPQLPALVGWALTMAVVVSGLVDLPRADLGDGRSHAGVMWTLRLAGDMPPAPRWSRSIFAPPPRWWCCSAPSCC